MPPGPRAIHALDRWSDTRFLALAPGSLFHLGLDRVLANHSLRWFRRARLAGTRTARAAASGVRARTAGERESRGERQAPHGPRTSRHAGK
jgi:hypothetical protein